MRWVRDAVVLLVALVLQSTVLHRIEIAGARPDLLVAYVVYIAWMRGSVVGTVRSEERRVGKECRSRWSPYH